ncbi:MAG TPA: metallophosphoesterase [Thermodesulfovibrionales bacterium]|nr:metallophosphoesterase [Thermodesulfovibrionales bacterium]
MITKRRFWPREIGVLLVALVLTISVSVPSSFAVVAAGPWKFGIISDTQWTTADPANQNPNTIPASIIKQINQQFININNSTHDLKFVIAMGDMVDTGSQANDYVRALYSQDLYNAGIGFYPMRGNHEAANGTYATSDADLWHAYPQLGYVLSNAGINNMTPSDITISLISPSIVQTSFPPDVATGSAFTVGSDFSYPTTANTANNSVSYSFQYDNATFMILDQFKSTDYYTSHIIPDQQQWISDALSGRPANTHAFAFTHKNILGGNHKDNMFGGNASGDPGDGYALDPVTGIPNTLADSTNISNTPGLTVGQKRANENTFLSLLQANKVKYMISGHDHHHYNSIVTSPDQQSKVHQLIAQSDSSKFYTPTLPVSSNDMPVEQDLARVGYYIFTVDGPRVTIDYYADNHGNWQSDSNYPYGANDLTNYPKQITPTFTFVKRSTTGYSLNGIEKLVAEGGSYAMTDDTTKATTMENGFLGTSMSILSGTNNSSAKTNYNKALTKAVNTGWAAKTTDTISDVLYLWGMTDLGAASTDKFALSMTYDPSVVVTADTINQGHIVTLSTKDGTGNWVDAVNQNVGTSRKRFILGPWNSAYPLGTYGVDPATHTAWVVINTTGSGQFAVVQK